MTNREAAVRNFAVMTAANAHIRAANKTKTHIRADVPKDIDFSSELLIEGWDENKAKQLPIQAFFYLMKADDDFNQYDVALQFQREFYEASGGETVPIVGI